MIHGEDPTALQAWLVAIPSAITAVSTWYINRKTKKTVQASHTVIADKSDTAAAAVMVEIESLKKRVTDMEEMVGKVRDCQLTIAQKYTESMNALQVDLKQAKRTLERLVSPSTQTPTVEQAPGATGSPTEAPPASEKTGSVKVVEEPKQPLGKVTWKK